MIKIYTNKTTTSKETVSAPNSAVIDTILNFSKSLEVLQLEKSDKDKMNNIEIVLN